MEVLVKSLGSGRYRYRPFSKEIPVPAWSKLPRTLEDLCYRAVVHRATLRGLKGRRVPCLPPLIRRKLTSLHTEEFYEVECAPFRDMFDFNIYHRALTYRVKCPLDGGEYMAAHAGNCNATELSEVFWQWVELSHANLMCVYALVLDVETANVFLIMDIPEATLKGLEIFLVSQGLCFPEYALWKVAKQLSSVIIHVEERGLTFSCFDLKNVYVIRNNLLLDNKLTWKSWVDTFFLGNRVQSIYLGDKINISGHYEPQANSPSSASVVCLGLVLSKLASIAFVDRSATVTETPRIGGKILFLDGFDLMIPDGPVTYSSDLFDMLVALHSSNPPPLANVHAKAVEMMAMLKANREKDAIMECTDNESLNESIASLE